MNNLINLFLEFGKKKTYKANDVIFNENEICDTVGFIFKGKIKISTFSSNEGEVVINLLSKNEFFGDLLLFSNRPYYYGMAIAQEATIVYFLSKNNLLKFFKEDSKLLEEFLMLVTNKGVLLKQTNKLLAHKNIEERLIYYLNHICKKDEYGNIYFKSVTDMANILSIPRPSLSRVLHKMEREKKIKINNHKIKLD